MTAAGRAGLLALALLIGAAEAGGHEEGVLHLNAAAVPVGGELGVRGTGFPEEMTLRLELRGTLDTHALGEFRTDSTGQFDARLTLPPEADTGRYTLVAVATDGDDVGTADLIVVAGTAADAASAAPREPSAEPMPLETARGAGEWLAIALFIGLCGGGGAALLAGGRARRGDED